MSKPETKTEQPKPTEKPQPPRWEKLSPLVEEVVKHAKSLGMFHHEAKSAQFKGAQKRFDSAMANLRTAANQ